MDDGRISSISVSRAETLAGRVDASSGESASLYAGRDRQEDSQQTDTRPTLCAFRDGRGERI